MKSVMISIKPKWCELIAEGKKTVEVRKTRPKCDTPFKCYIYCTKKKDFILDGEPDWGGKVIGEFVCDYITKNDWLVIAENELSVQYDEFPETTGLTAVDVFRYSKGKPFYGWHISNLKIYGEPKELSEFRHCGANYHYNPAISRPPQSWCYCEEPTDDLDEWELDPCYECTGYGDDYSYDEELDDLVSNCTNCPFFGRDD